MQANRSVTRTFLPVLRGTRGVSVPAFLALFLVTLLIVGKSLIAPRSAPAGKCVGGHDSAGVSAPSNTWYFAEGYTGGDFDEWVLVQNPNPASANITVTFMLPDGSNIQNHYTVNATSRFTIHVDDIVPHSAVSTKVESDQPVIAERAMYFTFNGKSGGHNSVGAAATADTWYLAEGYTGGGFDTWALIQNPNAAPADVKVTFMRREGAPVERAYAVGANSRFTIRVDDILPDDEVSTKVESTNDVGIIVERAVYFNHNGKDGGHDSMGVTSPSQTWYLAEGYTAGNCDEWILIQNPNPTTAEIGITYLTKGGEPQYYNYTVPADSRYTICVDEIPGMSAVEVSAAIHSDQPVIAERAMYFDFNGRDGGHDAAGTTSLSKTWYLAEGYTGGDFDEWILIQNPNSSEAHLNITYFVKDGGPVYCSYTVPANQRYSVHVDEAPNLGSAEVSARIESDQPVVAERAMYFAYDTTSLFNTSRALDHIWSLSAGIGPRKAGTSNEGKARDYIKTQFQNMGYDVRTQSFTLSNGATSENVIVTKAGTSSQRLVIGAHYDSKSNAPGANDNASGVGVILELARILKDIQTRPTIDFVAFGAEEIVDSNSDHHHFGSRHYAGSLSDADKGQITGMISVDMVGVGSLFYVGCMEIQPKVIADGLIASTSDVNYQATYFKSQAWSDHEAFERAGIPTAWMEWRPDPNYHSPNDTYDKISSFDIEATGRTLLEFVLSRN